MSLNTITNASILLKNTAVGNNIPFIGNSGYGQDGRTLWYIDGIAGTELVTKTPPLIGNTYSAISYLYLPGGFLDVIISNPVISCFGPSHIIDSNNEIYTAWRYSANNVNFANPSISGNTGDRFEVIYMDYSTTVVSTPTGTAAALTGLTFAMSILKGGSASDGGAGNFTAKQIYYRKIGNVVRPEE
jgi:hypothetical protein